MNNPWNRLKQNDILRRFFVLLIIGIVLYEARAMIDTILLTFIFTYIVIHIIKRVQKLIPRFPTKLIVGIIYLLVFGLLYFVITIYIPLLAKQFTKIVQSMISFYQSHQMTGILKDVEKYINREEIVSSARHSMSFIIHALTNVGTLTVALIMSVFLSFFYTFELNKMHQFSNLFVTEGSFKWFFEDLKFLGKKFADTFGVVLEAQFFIAICNTILTMIGLIILKMPQIVALGLMVFVLSLIPVAGVIISLIPLSLVAYSVGGLKDVVYILVLILIIHAIEAYFLNPKFMASKTQLPIFYTFLILLVAEKFWGTWGLIVGVPLFTFFIELIGINPRKNKPRKKQRLKISN